MSLIKTKVISQIWAHLSKDLRKNILTYLFLIPTGAFLELLLLYYFSKAVGEVLSDKSIAVSGILHINTTSFLNSPASISIFLALLVFLNKHYMNQKAATVIFGVTSEIFVNVYERLAWNKLEIFFGDKKSHIGFLTNKIDLITHGFVMPVCNLISSLVVLVVFVGYTFYVNYQLALITFIIFPIVYLYFMKVNKIRIEKISDDYKKLIPDYISRVSTTFNAIRELALWNLTQQYAAGTIKRFISLNQSRADSYKISLAPRNLVEVTLYVSVALIVVFNEIARDRLGLDPVSLIVYLLIFMRCIPSAQQAYYSYTNIKIGSGVLIELVDYLQSSRFTNQMKETSRNKNFNKIELKDIKFKYSENSPLIIDELNLEIRKGEKILIMGNSGVGKSTLLDIISGFLNPIGGKVLIDDVEEINGLSRINTCYIPQAPYLFDDTIIKNVVLDSDVNLERLYSVMNMVGLGTFINRLQEQIHSNGGKLSGGQKQRLALARALYSNRNLVLLDEITNGLDQETKMNIVQNIVNMPLTIILITHDNEIQKYFNRKYKMDKGSLIEFN